MRHPRRMLLSPKLNFPRISVHVYTRSACRVARRTGGCGTFPVCLGAPRRRVVLSYPRERGGMIPCGSVRTQGVCCFAGSTGGWNFFRIHFGVPGANVMLPDPHGGGGSFPCTFRCPRGVCHVARSMGCGKFPVHFGVPGGRVFLTGPRRGWSTIVSAEGSRPAETRVPAGGVGR